MTGNGGPATSATITWPRFLALDSAGNLFFSDYGNYHYIRKINAATGIVTQAIGYPSSTFCGADNTPANQHCLMSPWGIAADTAGNLVCRGLGTDSCARSRRARA